MGSLKQLCEHFHAPENILLNWRPKINQPAGQSHLQVNNQEGSIAENSISPARLTEKAKPEQVAESSDSINTAISKQKLVSELDSMDVPTSELEELLELSHTSWQRLDSGRMECTLSQLGCYADQHWSTRACLDQPSPQQGQGCTSEASKAGCRQQLTTLPFSSQP